MSMSPNAFRACSSISFARPDSPAPSAAVARRIRRPVPCTTLPVREPAAEAVRTRKCRRGSSPSPSPSSCPSWPSGGSWPPPASVPEGAGTCPSGPSAGVPVGSAAGSDEGSTDRGSPAVWTGDCCRGTAFASSGLPACEACSACCDGFSSATCPSCPRFGRTTRDSAPRRASGGRRSRPGRPGSTPERPGLCPVADRRVACPESARVPDRRRRTGPAARPVSAAGRSRAEWTRESEPRRKRQLAVGDRRNGRESTP